MWVFLNDAFVSAVQHEKDPEVMVLRARAEGDLERFLEPLGGHFEVLRTPQADYLFRAFVSRGAFTRALLFATERIDYPNFKASVQDDERHDVYLEVWHTMLRWQHRMLPWPRIRRRLRLPPRHKDQ